MQPQLLKMGWDMKCEGIDWEGLSKSLGLPLGGSEIGGDHFARLAISELLGTRALTEAVDYFVHRGPGAELTRSVLRLLRPAAAIERCLYIYQSAADIDVRRASVELLRFIDDGRALPAIKRFLADSDETIQNWGASLLDQLLSSQLITLAEADECLCAAEQHENPAVRQIARWIRESNSDTP
jgi:hypothetical protein